MSYGLRYKTILQSFLAHVLNEEVTTFSVLKFASPFARTSHKNKKNGYNRLDEKETNGVDEIWYQYFNFNYDLRREQRIVLTFNEYFNSFSNCSI